MDTLGRLAELYECSVSALLSDHYDFRHLDQAYQRRGSSGAPQPPGSIASPDTAMAVARGGHILKRPHLSPGLLEGLTAMTQTFRQMDYLSGARSVHGEVNAHLRRMLDLRDQGRTSATNRELLCATADVAQLAAWLAIDGQEYTTAKRHCRLALTVAEEAKDHGMHAYVLGVMSYISLHAGRGHDALKLLSAASEMATHAVPPAVRSWIAEARGEALALTGDQRAGLSSLHAAEVAFDKVTESTAPPWLAFYNSPVHAARLKGRCLVRLGHANAAIEVLNDSLRQLPPTYVRERGGTLIDLANALAQAGEIDEACRIAAQADELSRATSSQRNLRRLRELLVVLVPWNRSACVQELASRLLLS
ncbi:hypothetical protein [Spongiactinospora sp. 9N601]|uniref:hypothetical protein n=1 Tax=Spongiactinospora sp. 9N601 TaxID=3375149 RepID=UPI0037A588DF